MTCCIVQVIGDTMKRRRIKFGKLLIMLEINFTKKRGNMNKWEKLKKDFDIWSLHNRTEIVWFTIGFVIGAIIL